MAPLKQRMAASTARRHGFPRPHRRGPIEARTDARSRQRCDFPRPHRRGPIEALQRSTAGDASCVFHGLTAVAPLKLMLRLERSLPSTASFHGLTAVAPLKPHPSVRRPVSRLAFHGLIAVAPLKPSSPIVPCDATSFHGLTAVAPLKHASPSQRALSGLPRPHRRGPIEASCLRS